MTRVNTLLVRADRLLPWLAMIALAALFLTARAGHHELPVPGHPGWSGWYDQGKYIESARAWRALDLRPLHHWYMPGWPLLGAVFLGLTPADPFLLPSLLCLLASAWLFCGLGARLAGGNPGLRALAALAFVAAVQPGRLMDIWVVPWTSTPATVLTFACLLAAMRLLARPNPRDAALAGLSAAAIALFRPTDMLIAGLPAALALLWAVTRPGLSARLRLHVVLAGGGAAGLALLAVLALHLAVFGPVPGGYLELSGLFGFEWRLLPLRWVTLMVDPVPMLPDGQGLARMFPWIIAGVAGLLVQLLAPGRGRSRAAPLLVAGAVALHLVLFLSYRDLHAQGLWRYNNYHYFKWVLPVLMFGAALLLRALLTRARLVPALACAAAAIALFAWRIVPAPLPTTATVTGPHTLLLPDGIGPVTDALLVPGTGTEDNVFFSVHHMQAGGRDFETPYAFRAFPRQGGLLLEALRPPPPGPATLTFDPGVTLDPALAVQRVAQTLRPGLPCFILPHRRVCTSPPALPGRLLPLDTPIAFGATAMPYLGYGWSAPDNDGSRWTDGPEAGITVRVPPDQLGGDLLLRVQAGGYVPRRDTRAVDVGVLVNGAQVAGWHPESGNAWSLQARIPAALVPPDGNLVLRLVIENPRRPADYDDGADSRRLGLHMVSLEITKASASP